MMKCESWLHYNFLIWRNFLSFRMFTFALGFPFHWMWISGVKALNQLIESSPGCTRRVYTFGFYSYFIILFFTEITWQSSLPLLGDYFPRTLNVGNKWQTVFSYTIQKKICVDMAVKVRFQYISIYTSKSATYKFPSGFFFLHQRRNNFFSALLWGNKLNFWNVNALLLHWCAF